MRATALDKTTITMTAGSVVLLTGPAHVYTAVIAPANIVLYTMYSTTATGSRAPALLAVRPGLTHVTLRWAHTSVTFTVTVKKAA
jgi:hypothetical protein